ncbi:MAG: isoprenylcysteine carboxylmethyltransferase family protein [Gemmatimonadetes bacterium]|nr:isoprenylcysteine carboxylmethyltransferase family protein [Gemmatimonadota bacterium]
MPTSLIVTALPALTVMLGWAVFMVLMVRRARATDRTTRRRDPWSWVGISLQGIAFGIAWSLERFRFARLVDTHETLATLRLMVVILLVAASLRLFQRSLATLGTHWSLVARVGTAHQLITSGPYAKVRHPIYVAMFGMLLAASLAMGGPVCMLPGAVLFVLGTVMRVRREDSLLRAEFGASFDLYAARVGALVPRTRSS